MHPSPDNTVKARGGDIRGEKKLVCLDIFDPLVGGVAYVCGVQYVPVAYLVHVVYLIYCVPYYCAARHHFSVVYLFAGSPHPVCGVPYACRTYQVCGGPYLCGVPYAS